MAALLDRRDRSVVRRINDLMWQSLDDGGRTQPVPFVCECGRPGCYQTVWLTPEGYEEGRADSAWSALAPGHRRAAATA